MTQCDFWVCRERIYPFRFELIIISEQINAFPKKAERINAFPTKAERINAFPTKSIYIKIIGGNNETC